MQKVNFHRLRHPNFTLSIAEIGLQKVQISRFFSRRINIFADTGFSIVAACGRYMIAIPAFA